MNKWDKSIMDKAIRDRILSELGDQCPRPLATYEDIVKKMKRLEYLKAKMRENMDTTMANGFYNSHPCMQCGEMSCSDGVKLCARCRLAEARDILALNVPRTTQQDTIKGWKVGHIVKVVGKWQFRGMTQAATYGVQAEFECCCGKNLNTTVKHTKMFPGEQKDWRCGFYSSKTPKGIMEADNFDFLRPRMYKQDIWLLEVELYGEVHKHKDGYKAEKQRVLSVRPYAQPNYPTLEGVARFVQKYTAESGKSLDYDDQYSLYQMFDAWMGGSNPGTTYVEYMSRGWPGPRLVYGVPGALEDKGRVIGRSWRSELTSKLGTSVREWDAEHCIEGPQMPPARGRLFEGSMCPCPMCSSRQLSNYGFLDPGYPYNTGGYMGGRK